VRIYFSFSQIQFQNPNTYLFCRLDIQEALKRPMKQKRKLRIFISNTFYPAKEGGEGEEGSVASWELRVEGRLLEDSKNDPNKVALLTNEPAYEMLALEPFIFLSFVLKNTLEGN
jgi:hypothetical protein